MVGKITKKINRGQGSNAVGCLWIFVSLWENETFSVLVISEILENKFFTVRNSEIIQPEPLL